MSTVNKILQQLSSLIRHVARRSKSKLSCLLGAVVLAGLAACGGSANAFTPTNVLVNPGAETGDLTGWTTEAAVGYVFVVSTNGTIPNSGGSNFLAHSGSHTFEMFNTTGDYVAIYQDFAAISNSLWSANVWAICYASNYPSTGNAHMQVVFYDISNNIVAYTNVTSSGVLGTDFLDPTLIPGVWWIINPPPAVDASGWVYLEPTNLYTTDPATEASYDPSQPTIPEVLTAPVGTAKVRYQLQFSNPSTGGGDVYFDDCALMKLNQTDPDISTAPVPVTTYAGLPASFSVVAAHTGQYPNEKLSYQWQYNGTNLPANGGVNDIVGPTTGIVLSFTNLHGADSGLYSVVVTLKSTAGNYTNSITSVPVPLTVQTLSPRQKANALGPNAGFENAPQWSPWLPFNGCYLAGPLSAVNNTYDGTTPINVLDGSWVCLIGANGDRDDGVYTQIPAARGSVWKAGGYAYISSSNNFVGGNTERLQIWFVDSGGGTVAGTPTYESFKLYGMAYTNVNMQYTNIDTSSSNFGQVMYHAQLPRDQWCYMQVTNVVNNGGIGLGDDLPYNTLPGYFTVPTNAGVASINFQMYEYVPGGPGITDTNADGSPSYPGGYLGTATDSVYWDDMELFQVLPVTNLTASISGNQINLSFSAGAGLNYAVQYKANLNDATWNTLTTVAAPMSWQTNINATTITYPLVVPDTINPGQNRFYRIQSE